MRGGLVWLALRRTLSPAMLLVLALGLGLGLVTPGSGDPLLPGEEAAVLLRDSRRLDVWSAFLVLVAPVLLFVVARQGSHWSLRWIRPSPEPRPRAALALLVGTLAGGVLAVLATAAAAEWAAGAGPPALRAVARYETPGALLTAAAPEISWHTPELARRARPVPLRLAVTVAPGSGPAAPAVWRADLGPAPPGEVHCETRVAGRAWLRLTLPAEPSGEGPAPVFTLARATADGAVLVLLPDGLERLAPVASERLGSIALALHVLLLAAAAFALALGLAAHVRPTLAAGVPLAATLGVVGTGLAPGVLPGGDLGAAWSQMATGLVPAWPAPAVAWTTLALVGVGLALASRPGEART